MTIVPGERSPDVSLRMFPGMLGGNFPATGAIAQRWGMVHLLDCAADLREHIAGVCSDEPDGADDNDENDGQHHGILSDVLSFFIAPKLA